MRELSWSEGRVWFRQACVVLQEIAFLSLLGDEQCLVEAAAVSPDGENKRKLPSK